MTRVVIDTNTFVSGIFWEGNEAKIVKHCIDGVLHNYTSLDIINEVERVLGYKKFKLTKQEIVKFLQIYISFSTIITSSKPVKISVRDPTDTKFIECAVAANAKYIITGDEDLLVLERYQGIEIIRSKKLLDQLK